MPSVIVFTGVFLYFVLYISSNCFSVLWADPGVQRDRDPGGRDREGEGGGGGEEEAEEIHLEQLITPPFSLVALEAGQHLPVGNC